MKSKSGTFMTLLRGGKTEEARALLKAESAASQYAPDTIETRTGELPRLTRKGKSVELGANGQWQLKKTSTKVTPSPKFSRKSKDKRIHISRFGFCRALLFGDTAGSVEIGIGRIEMSRLLATWEETEVARKRPDDRVLGALRLLISKARQSSPEILAEVPIASTRRVLFTPDNEHDKD